MDSSPDQTVKHNISSQANNDNYFSNNNNQNFNQNKPQDNNTILNKDDAEAERIDFEKFMETHIQPTLNALRSQKSNGQSNNLNINFQSLNNQKQLGNKNI